VLAVHVGLPARQVARQRLELIEAARAPLRGARSVMALDVGWVGAATSAPVLDLAGVTDPVVANLPGGHTSKRVPEGLIEGRAVDAAVLLLAPGTREQTPWASSRFARAVEARVAAFSVVSELALWASVPLAGTEQRYLIVGRR
jgi:hypothetical protein